MKINIQTGLLDEARQVCSPHFNERPEGVEPELIVLHNISLPPGEFSGSYIDDLFCHCLDPEIHPYFKTIYQLEVSAHVLIRRSGEIVQYVPFHQRAWHAGVSSYQGRAGCNDFSIGIELEGTDCDPYEAIQYQNLVLLVQALLCAYTSLSRAHITGHSDIAPGRKTDPGPAFDWQLFFRQLDAPGNRGKITSPQ